MTVVSPRVFMLTPDPHWKPWQMARGGYIVVRDMHGERIATESPLFMQAVEDWNQRDPS